MPFSPPPPRRVRRVRRTLPPDNFVGAPGDYYRSVQSDVVLHRLRPGRGFVHVVSIADLRTFLALLPDWDTLSDGLDAVVLAPGLTGEFDEYGYHTTGVVHLRAWPRGWWRGMSPDLLRDSAPVLERLGVPFETDEDGWAMVHWTAQSARDFLLLNVLLHELGHHHDRITTRSRRQPSRGESYAEAYAQRYEQIIWDRYWENFAPR